jgi:hypothetical protein
MLEIINTDGGVMTDGEIAELAAGVIGSMLMDFIRAEDGRADWSDPAMLRRGVEVCDPIAELFVETFGRERGNQIIIDAAHLLLALRDRPEQATA